ncbi:MAG: B12-binding domain-containing radical SAM protein [Acidimicrobiia bacterium]|nr:B12-binding domain-containing radical SAM protein [Acidimicrobiia bacterium]
MRTVLVTDSLAFSLMAVRPEDMWDIDWQDQRNKNLLSPEYGIQYIAAYLKKVGRPFDVVNVIGAAEDISADFFRNMSNRALVDSEAADRMDAWLQSRWDAVLAQLEAMQPDVILYPMMYYFMIVYVKRLLGEIRKRCPNATIVTGGNYATLHADEIALEGLVDFIVVGEGENTAAELLDVLEAGATDPRDLDGLVYKDADGAIVRTRARARENDLDTFPHLYTAGEEFLIRRRHDILCELIPYGDYWPGTGIITARGCPEKCSFCLDPAIWSRKVRFHSAEYIADAVRFCHENYPTEHNRFFFGDSTFTLRWKRLEPMLDMLAEIGYSYTCQTRADALDERRLEKMAECGWVTVGIGAESVNNEVLNEIALKREDADEIIEAALAARRTGIQPVLTLIAGFPGESRESLIDSCDKLRMHGLHVSSFFPLVVFRGISLFEGFGTVEGFTRSGSYYERRDDDARLNPWSEEWLRLSDEFPTRDDLIGFTQYLNKRVRLPIEEKLPV